MKKSTRILAFVLTLLMFVSVMPLTLFAANENAAQAVSEDDSEALLEELASQATGELYTRPNHTSGVLQKSYDNFTI